MHLIKSKWLDVRVACVLIFFCIRIWICIPLWNCICIWICMTTNTFEVTNLNGWVSERVACLFCRPSPKRPFLCWPCGPLMYTPQFSHPSEFKHTCRKRSFPMDKDGLEFIFEETLVVKQMSQGQGPPSSILPSHPITRPPSYFIILDIICICSHMWVLFLSLWRYKCSVWRYKAGNKKIPQIFNFLATNKNTVFFQFPCRASLACFFSSLFRPCW